MSDKIRSNVRFSAEDTAWLAEHAEDEGVEPATLVRMIISRLRKGRPPLVSMMVAAPRSQQRTVVVDDAFRPDPLIDPTLVDGTAEDILASRLAELDGGNVEQLHQPEGESAAIPLRRVAREQYNPGRR